MNSEIHTGGVKIAKQKFEDRGKRLRDPTLYKVEGRHYLKFGEQDSEYLKAFGLEGTLIMSRVVSFDDKDNQIDDTDSYDADGRPQKMRDILINPDQWERIEITRINCLDTTIS